MPDNQINGVDPVPPFRFSDGHWQLGIRRPVSLRIGEIVNQVTARNSTADLQGTPPWSEPIRCSPLTSASICCGGKLDTAAAAYAAARPGADPLRSISPAANRPAPSRWKQFAASGAVSGVRCRCGWRIINGSSTTAGCAMTDR